MQNCTNEQHALLRPFSPQPRRADKLGIFNDDQGGDTNRITICEKNDAGHPPTTCRVQIPSISHDARGTRKRYCSQHLVINRINDNGLAKRPKARCSNFVGLRYSTRPITWYYNIASSLSWSGIKLSRVWLITVSRELDFSQL